MAFLSHQAQLSDIIVPLNELYKLLVNTNNIPLRGGTFTLVKNSLRPLKCRISAATLSSPSPASLHAPSHEIGGCKYPHVPLLHHVSYRNDFGQISYDSPFFPLVNATTIPTA
jgi:hypothetical protein